jgi:hypothetical protein
MPNGIRLDTKHDPVRSTHSYRLVSPQQPRRTLSTEYTVRYRHALLHRHPTFAACIEASVHRCMPSAQVTG